MPPRALLFDFDGVIADTENHHVAAWQRTFSMMGWEIADDVCARAAEVNDAAFLAGVFAQKKIEGGDVEGWVARKQALTVAMLADSPRVYPGVAELVNRLKEKVLLGVVTTTWRANVTTVLEASGLAPAFRLIVAKEDCEALKPDPEPYRLAVEHLGVAATEAIALEDSPGGLASARAAGLRVIAVGHRRAQGPWSDHAPFVGDLRDTKKVLALINRRGTA